MDPDFNWPENLRLNTKQKEEIQNEIKDVINSHDDPKFNPCHPGEPKINLNIVGKMLSDVVGNIECTCRVKYLIIDGNIDTSEWIFKEVKL